MKYLFGSKSSYYRKKKQIESPKSCNNINTTSSDIEDLFDENEDQLSNYENENNYIESKIEQQSIENSPQRVNDDNSGLNEVFNEDISLNENISNKREMYAALISLFFSGKFTQTAFNSILDIIKLTTNLKIPKTFLSLKNKFLKDIGESINYDKYFFCARCNSELIQESFSNCKDCNEKASTCYLFDVENQIRRILPKVDLQNVRQRNKDVITDIYDSDIYSTFYEINKDNYELETVFTLSINTDGIRFSNCSNLQLWPIFLVVNELPIHKRFLFQNIIVAGLISSYSKPNLNDTLGPLIDNLKILEDGIIVNINDCIRQVKIYVISGVFDKPARSSFLNFKLSTGFFGCIKCYQKGESFYRDNKSGRTHIYPFDGNYTGKNLRTEQSYNFDLNMAIATKKDFRGVKGETILSGLSFYRPLKCTNIDYMHSSLYGVVYYLINFWISYEYSNKPFSLIKYTKNLNNRLQSIRPFQENPYIPRSIEKFKEWKAHEIQSFVLYYGLFILNGILEVKYYENFILLVIIFENLLARSIEKNNLVIIHDLIIKFVKQSSEIYPPEFMLSGMHELLHLVQCTLDFGPINLVSCFQFEELNRKLKNLIKGKSKIGDEFIGLFTLIQNLESYVSKTSFSNDSVYNFVRKNSKVRCANVKYTNNKEKNLIFVGRKLKKSEFAYSYLVNIGLNISISDVFYKSVNVNMTKFTTINNESKRCDFCVITNNMRYGFIYFLKKSNNTVYAVVRELVKLHNPFYDPEHVSLKSKTSIFSVSDDFFIDQIENLNKIFLINFDKHAKIAYLSEFDSIQLFK